ncbi:MAG TPA: GNAT family N-acetyltransferase [Roseiflexaceae bacterium]|nr:GNAT family N-acetyltransferase [Roseiflexaceae bacterium]
MIRFQRRFFQTDGHGQEIATAVVHRRHGVQFLTDVWVHPDHRRGGLGSELVKAALAECGGEDLYLTVSGFTNQPLTDEQLAQWYARFGFELVGPAAPGMMRRPACPS